MEFFFDNHSSLPAHLQLQEQIKLALLLGRLRPGDTLPSIRDVEQETGISRNIVRKSYLALQRSGILNLRHGKGVLVEKGLNYRRRDSIMANAESLARETLSKVERLGISPTAFVRYLYQHANEQERSSCSLVFVDAAKAISEERAAKISAFWRVNILGLSMDELAAMSRSEQKRIRIILTNYLRHDQVKRLVKDSSIEVVPLSLKFTDSMRKAFSRLPPNASVVLVLDDRDYPSLSLILESYRQLLADGTMKLSAVSLSEIPDLYKFVTTSRYHKIWLSNRIWDQVPDKIRKHSRVSAPQMEIDLASLESIRIMAGVII